MKEYVKLLFRREAGEVLGRHWSNLWLLTLVLLATFLSIAFSQGSMAYLSDKMDDPFTNWLNITNDRDGGLLREFIEDLQEPEIQNRFGYTDVQEDHVELRTFFTANGSQNWLHGRFFNHINTDLVRAILDDDNVISGHAISFDLLSDNSMGIIVTADVLVKKLGYSLDDIPAYIYLAGVSDGADSLYGVALFNDYAPMPLPVLGVVEKLPSNMDFVSTDMVYSQIHNTQTYPFNLKVNGAEYLKSFYYYISPSVDNITEVSITSLFPDSLRNSIAVYHWENKPELLSWENGFLCEISLSRGQVLSVPMCNRINQELLSAFPKGSILRLYNYNTSKVTTALGDFVSVAFQRLDSIRAFEQFAKQNYRVNLDMAQVNAKENFNAVSTMATILSFSMIVFSLVCIIMFLVNMLQSYFQKVKRNIGTFKAFGIDSRALIGIYILISMSIVAGAVCISLVITAIIQLLLFNCGIVQETGYGYLQLAGELTYWSVVVILLSTMITVYFVMYRFLHQTPGNLIYDR